jgi:hypothetical protein
MAEWSLARRGARLDVSALGGMVEAALRLSDGRVVKPLWRPQWADDPEAPEGPPLMRALRGEWLCVPFGYARPSETLAQAWHSNSGAQAQAETWPHGYSANHAWRLLAQDADHLAIAIDYPPDVGISRLERHLALASDGSGFNVESVIHVRRECRVPVALHATFALPRSEGQVRLVPGQFELGYTHPTSIEPGRSHVAVDARFNDLTQVPAALGGTLRRDRLPLPTHAEEVLFLANTDGSFVLEDETAGIRTSLRWDPARLPHCQIWISNCGRTAFPWNGDNLCVGIEPCVSAMDLASAISAAANPLTEEGFRTCVELSPESPWRCEYTLTVEPHR